MENDQTPKFRESRPSNKISVWKSALLKTQKPLRGLIHAVCLYSVLYDVLYGFYFDIDTEFPCCAIQVFWLFPGCSGDGCWLWQHCVVVRFHVRLPLRVVQMMRGYTKPRGTVQDVSKTTANFVFRRTQCQLETTLDSSTDIMLFSSFWRFWLFSVWISSPSLVMNV